MVAERGGKKIRRLFAKTIDKLSGRLKTRNGSDLSITIDSPYWRCWVLMIFRYFSYKVLAIAGCE